MEKGKSIEASKGKYILLEDPSGASLSAQVTSKNQIIGILPFYRGESKFPVAIVKKVLRSETELEGAFHAWAVPQEQNNPESGLFPFVFDLPDYYSYDFKFPFNSEINLSAFATNKPEIFADENRFKENPENYAMKMGVKSFIPTGLFEADEQDGPTSRALITGKITKVSLKKNTIGKGEFIHLLTETSGGETDMLIAKELLPVLPKPGNIISGKFWLCGKVN